MRLLEMNTGAAASSTVARNIVANFLGGTWAGVMALAFIPLYIKLIGIESYGLIGIYASLRALFAVLDMGLSTTLNRELARLSVVKGANQEARDLVRTFEMIYWGVGIVIGGVLVALAPLIARHWLHAQGVTAGTVEQAVMIMGLVLAFEWPVSLYFGGLMGLQRQVLLNGAKAIAATFRSGGAVLVLWLISPSIQAYFIWQIIVTSAQTLLMAGCLWASLPMGDGHTVFRKELWFDKWKFATGIAGITLLATILTQLDKVILSNLLTLELFGYYAVAAAVAGSLNYIASPIFSALFPRFTQGVAEGKEADLVLLYHKGCQLMSVIVVPGWIIVALFSKELLSLWIRNLFIVKNTYLLVSLIITGTAFNSIMLLPLALQLAHGWTKLSFYKNVVSVILFIPMLIWLIKHYGSAGAAVAWIALNAGYILIEVPLMHRRLLKEEMWRWYFVDVGLPLLVSLCIGICARVFMPNGTSAYLALLYIAAVSLVALLSSGLATPATREWLQKAFRRSMRLGHLI
jgi:O-antigen/teichoic acid export membrane protein